MGSHDCTKHPQCEVLFSEANILLWKDWRIFSFHHQVSIMNSFFFTPKRTKFYTKENNNALAIVLPRVNAENVEEKMVVSSLCFTSSYLPLPSAILAVMFFPQTSSHLVIFFFLRFFEILENPRLSCCITIASWTIEKSLAKLLSNKLFFEFLSCKRQWIRSKIT